MFVKKLPESDFRKKATKSDQIPHLQRTKNIENTRYERILKNKNKLGHFLSIKTQVLVSCLILCTSKA